MEVGILAIREHGQKGRRQAGIEPTISPNHQAELGGYKAFGATGFWTDVLQSSGYKRCDIPKGADYYFPTSAIVETQTQARVAYRFCEPIFQGPTNLYYRFSNTIIPNWTEGLGGLIEKWTSRSAWITQSFSEARFDSEDAGSNPAQPTARVSANKIHNIVQIGLLKAPGGV